MASQLNGVASMAYQCGNQIGVLMASAIERNGGSENRRGANIGNQ